MSKSAFLALVLAGISGNVTAAEKIDGQTRCVVATNVMDAEKRDMGDVTTVVTYIQHQLKEADERGGAPSVFPMRDIVPNDMVAFVLMTCLIKPDITIQDATKEVYSRRRATHDSLAKYGNWH